MTIYIAPIVQATDSFGQWLGKTNQVINAISNSAVTVNSNTSVGNAAITGTFTAFSYVTANSGSLFLGTGTANSSINASSILLRASSTSNSVISPAGMLIDGTTAYTKTLISLNNTVITTANVNSNAAYFSDKVIVGNVSIFNNSMVVSTANILNAAVGTKLYVGAQDGNTNITRDGIFIVYNDNLPAGDTNSYLTAYELNVGRITTKKLTITEADSNTSFNGNVFFYGANNFFGRGFNANGNASFNRGQVTFNSNVVFNASNNYFINGLTSANTILTLGDVTSRAGLYTTDFVQFNGSTSGYTRLKANSVAGSQTFVLPTIDGNNGDVLITDGTGKLRFNPPFTGTLSTDFLTRDVRARSVGVGTVPSGLAGDIRAAGNITAYFSSDQRLKENISNITDALSKVQAINGVEFDWTDEYIAQHGGQDDIFMRKHDIGVIAQEIENVLPEVVAQRPDGYKAVRYEKIIALLIEAIKELKSEVDSLKNGH